MQQPKKEDTMIKEQRNVETRDWYAWINLMPPKPDDFHVVGEATGRKPWSRSAFVRKGIPRD